MLCCSPIFAEIVPVKSRTSIYALDQSFESILASFAPPLVGILAQHVYGYKPIPKGSSEQIEVATDKENAASLAKALYAAMGIPMFLCTLIYTFLYCTYPRDRERAQMDSLIQSELQHIELESCNAPGENLQLHFPESEVYGKQSRFEKDSDNDDKTLLAHW